MNKTKKIILTLNLLLLFSQFLYADTLLRLGDNMYEYMKANLVKFSMPAGNVSPWVEGQDTLIFFYKEGFDFSKPKFFSTKNQTVFAVLQEKNSNAYFLFDTENDSILDYKSDALFLPLWLVIANSKNIDPDPAKIDKYLNSTFNSFQSNDGLKVDGEQKAFVDSLNLAKTDVNFPNRDLYYMLYYYTKFTNKDPSQALLAMI
jgi:hypothetical protein